MNRSHNTLLGIYMTLIDLKKIFFANSKNDILFLLKLLAEI